MSQALEQDFQGLNGRQVTDVRHRLSIVACSPKFTLGLAGGYRGYLFRILPPGVSLVV
jgi:hypothetical protein